MDFLKGNNFGNDDVNNINARQPSELKKGSDLAQNILGNQSDLETRLATPLPNIKTYKTDVSYAVQKDNISAVKIALAEQARENRISDIELQSNAATTKSIVLISLTVFCFLVAIGGTWYFIHKANTPVVSLPQTTKEIVTTNYVATIKDVDALTTPELIREIRKAQSDFDTQSAIQINKLSLIGASSSPLSAQTFLYRINANVPGNVSRGLNQSYFIGFAKNGTATSSPYIVFQNDSYEQAYAGMFEWEKTLVKDMSDVFNITTLSPYFSDVVIKNKDVRAVIFKDQILLLYTFLDSKTIVITNSQKALENVTDAYLLSKRVQ